MSVGTITDAAPIEEPGRKAAGAAPSSAAKNERRVLAATVTAMVSVIGILLFAVHAAMRDYVVELGAWYF